MLNKYLTVDAANVIKLSNTYHKIEETGKEFEVVDIMIDGELAVRIFSELKRITLFDGRE